ncbi:MAG TPA: NrfD/PsrC family molybdoenzyme membrane anchor subunit [Herpetosiphonaceae bacterium]
MSVSYERTWENRRKGGRSVTDESRASYYGIPAIHKPHWKWLIICYFFLGGISSASYVIASIAELFGGRDTRRIVRVGRYISLAALIPSPILLILDLGRPERFLYMLRIVKLRSPMSVGTWGLTLFGGFCALSALIQAAQDGLLSRANLLSRALLALPSKTISVLGGAFGFFVGGYTGVLLGATAVPLWARNALLLGPLFLSSAMSSASAAITLVLALMRGTSHQTIRRLERLDTAALLAELGLILAARRNAGAVIGRPVQHGPLSRILRWGVLGLGVGGPLLLQSIGRLSDRLPVRGLAVLSSVLTLTGGFLLRYVMVMAGRASADDPEATYELARRG